MTDVLTKEQRRKNMQAIRSRDTSPEIRLRHALHKAGFRYRLNAVICGVRPDVVLPKWRTAIFLHGCFWHRHKGCRYATVPKSNTGFWLEKFRRNIERDRRQLSLLLAEGWRVCIVWECALKTPSWIIEKLVQNIRNSDCPCWESPVP